jgi:hypothetical protein
MQPSMDLLRLLASGIDPWSSYNLLTTPVVAAGRKDVCRFLVEHGVNINYLNPYSYDRLHTPLHCAGTVLC